MKRNNGFTLVELLAVIAILAILIIIALPNILKMYNKAKIDTNKVVTRSYANTAEKYYATVMGNDSTFDGATNVAQSLEINGKRAESERVYIDESGDVAVYLIIDGDCYYKIFGSEEVVYEKGAGVCEGANTKIAGYPVDYVNSGNGLYANSNNTLLTYKSDYTAAAYYIKYTDINCEDPSWGDIHYYGSQYCSQEDSWFRMFIDHKKLKKGDPKKVRNYIYFNCSSTDPRSCEKWRILKYEGGVDGVGGNLVLVSPDQHEVRYDNSYILRDYYGSIYDNKNTLAMAITSNKRTSSSNTVSLGVKANNPFRYNDIIEGDSYYWEIDDYRNNYYSTLSTSAKSLITKTNYYNGKMCGEVSDDYLFFRNGTYAYNINDNESSQYTNEWGDITIRDYVNASNHSNCINGAEISKTANSVSICNNWLNDGSWFFLSNKGDDLLNYDYCNYWDGTLFVGDAGIISTNLWLGIRSVVTLKTSSTIIGGSGTFNSPYILNYN